MSVQLMQGDCLELMKEVPDGSVDMVLADPPYGTMNGAELDGWEIETTKWDNAIPPENLFAQYSRILKPNGRAVVFSQEPYTSRLITSVIAPMDFCYRAIWYKNVHANALLANVAMVSRFEDICIFSKTSHKRDFDRSNPLRSYFAQVLNFIGEKSCKNINKILGHRKAEHCFYGTGSSQFELCTESTYNQLIEVFGIDKMDGFRPFSELSEIYKKFNLQYSQNGFRKSVFNLWEGKKSKSNVLEYAKDAERFHPTQKPVPLLEDLIRTYTNEGETVLDNTMGSGSTGVAAVNTGRSFIGMELDTGYFDTARRRIKEAQECLNKS